ncbi:MAG: hypothetical protein KDA51_06675, partial [Planctomycetales bacterium]|nr:hypothetical protein [Planctomycetales bacterium]
LREVQRELNEQATESNCRAWNLNFQCGTLASLNEPTDAQRAWMRNCDSDWSCWLRRNDGESRLLEEASIEQRPSWEKLLEKHLQLALSQTFREHALDSFAQLVLFESTVGGSNQKAEQVIAQSIAALGKAASLLPRPISQPVRVIRVAASERAENATLLWAMYNQELPADTASLVTLYGRGRLPGPTLQGDAIQLEALLAQLVLVGQACECGTQRHWVQYPHLPIAWPEDLQADVAHHLGFDPRSTLVVEEVKRIIQRGPQSLLNGRDDVGDVVNSTLSLAGSHEFGELSASVIQGDGWGFESPAALGSSAAADQSPQMLAIPPGRNSRESAAEHSSATVNSSAANIAQHAPIAEASGGRNALVLLFIAIGISLGILLSLRHYKSSSINRA